MSYLYHQREPGLSFGEPPVKVTPPPVKVTPPPVVTPPIRVTPAPAPIPILTGPTSLQRGTRGNYQVINAPPGATFSNWRFSGGGGTFPRTGNNNTDNWGGTMVQSGTISVVVTAGGSVRTLTLPVTVTPRPWTENAAQVPLVRQGNGTLPAQPRLGRPGVDPRDPGLGTSITTNTRNLQTMVVNGGPNDQFNFVPNPPVTWTTRAFTNEALYDTTHPFFRAHDPRRRGLPLPGGRLQIGFIQKNVEAHEGIISPPPAAPAGYASHHQALLNHLRANPINPVVERSVSHTSREPIQAYGNRLNAFVIAQTQAALRASQPHPAGIFPGPMYFDYPYITSRSLALRVGGSAGRLNVVNRPGGTRWSSTNSAVATVDASGTVRPVGPGRAIIRVTNKDGDVDEIPVTVSP